MAVFRRYFGTGSLRIADVTQDMRQKLMSMTQLRRRAHLQRLVLLLDTGSYSASPISRLVRRKPGFVIPGNIQSWPSP